MKRWLLVLLLLGMRSEASAQTYYVDATTGNDSWVGTLPDSQGGNGPWKTISKVNLSSFQPGDAILFKCGEMWREQLVIPSSGSSTLPITFGRYGENCSDSNKPAIVGSEFVSGWTLHSNNIYVADVNLQQPIVSLITNRSFDLDKSGWNVWSADALSSINWLASETGTGGHISIATSLANSGLAISNTFSLQQGKPYKVEFKLKATQPGQSVTAIVRRNGVIINGTANYDSVGLNQVVLPTTDWVTYSYSFVATSAEVNSARLDFSVPSGQTLYVDDVSVLGTVADYAVVNQVFVDGKFSILAQHPNPAQDDRTNSYFQITQNQPNSSCPNTGSAGTSAISTNLVLESGQLLDGAGIHIRTNNWIIDDRSVVAYDAASNVITFDKASSYNLCQGWGYYVDNKFWMLDSPGEWYFDKALRKLFIWMPDGLAPDARVDTGFLDYGIYAKSRANLVIDNLSISHSQVGIDATSSVNVTLKNIDIADSGINGITASRSTNLVVDSSQINRSVREGVRMEGSSNATVSNNKVIDSGVIGTPKKSHAGIFADSSNANIINNVVKNSGYNGIYAGTTNTLSENYIQNSCTVLDDCGAIYIGGPNGTPNGTAITRNIIVNVLGNPNGRPASSGSAGQGIYLDEFAGNIQATGNTVINADYGFQLHKAANNVLLGNTVYGARASAIWMQEDSSAGSIHDNSIRENQFFPTNSNTTYNLSSNFSGINFASYDFNRYSNLYSDILFTESYYPAGNLVATSYSLPQWQNARGHDLSSTSFNGFSLAFTRILSTVGANLVGNSTFDGNVSLWGYYHGATPPTWIANCVDGGCLKFTRDSQAGGQVNTSAFSVQQGVNYVLKFDARADQGVLNVKTLVRRAGAPNYYSVGLEKAVQFNSNWETYAMPFTASETRIYDPGSAGSGARLDFEVPVNQTIYIDNVRIEAANVESNSTGDDSLILVNDSTGISTVACPDSNPEKCFQYAYFADGNHVVWPVTLQPMSSNILVWANNTFRDDDHDGVATLDDDCLNTPPSTPVNVRGCSFFQRYPADLVVTVATPANFTNVNGNLVYSVTVTNTGSSLATGVVVTDILPASLTFVSAIPNQGACTGGAIVTCDIGSLASGASGTITIVATPTIAGIIGNMVSVAAIEYDPNPANNNATVTTLVNAVADLSIATTVSSNPVDVSGQVTYSITVTNTGPSDTSGVTVSNPLPAGVSFIFASAGCTGGATVICNIGNLASGASATLTITLTPTVAGNVTSTVTVTGADYDPNITNNSVITITTVQTVLSISKTGNGTVTASLGTINCGPTCSASYDANTIVSLTATPDASTDFGGWSGCDTVTGTTCTVSMGASKAVTANFTSKSTDLSVSITASATVNQGQTVTYNITVTNTGPSVASGIALSGPSGCTLPATTLASGANMNCTVTVTASTVGNLTQTVSVTGTETDPNTANNSASATSQVQGVLTVSKAGSGTVSSTPTGINCGSTCTVAYDANTQVTLTATADASYVFSSWNGCDSVTGNICTVTMSTSKPVTANFSGVPELTEASLTASTSGTNLLINDQVLNQGTGAATSFDISYYLSSNASYEAGTDTLLCKRTLTSLAAGVSDPASGTTQSICAIPSVAGGGYYVLARVDSGNTATEANESNNLSAATVAITGIDLTPQSTSATRVSNSSTKVSITETVKNQGNVNAGSFAIRYYLSTNTTYESTDIPLASSSNGTGTCNRTRSSLNKGASSTVSGKTCYKPSAVSGLVVGETYNVLVVNDWGVILPGGAIVEYNEANNVSVAGTVKW